MIFVFLMQKTPQIYAIKCKRYYAFLKQVARKVTILLFSCKIIVNFMQSKAENIVHFKCKWGEKVRVLLRNNCKFKWTIWNKHQILEICLAQILFYGSQLWKKAKFFLVCGKIIAYLHRQWERNKMHIFKVIKKKFVEFIVQTVKSGTSSMNYKNMHFGIQLWENKVSVMKKLSKFY